MSGAICFAHFCSVIILPPIILQKRLSQNDKGQNDIHPADFMELFGTSGILANSTTGRSQTAARLTELRRL